ncbi:C-C motif chemokine 13-like [Archocentrus centrarchus]|uniref:C-C motif chemokine 13-like n=1 Tax=Archocentrus centrarchus TaxID=63155 RepID=UPI0011E9CE00|nr:C-C motif chemokine 13-like [Archocentrus centrarchus]
MMMMMMKNPVILMACIFLLSSLVISDNTFGPDKCCFQFIKERLPKTKVLSFEYTDKRCAMEGVLLRMLKGKQICADPTMQWVKRIMKVVGTRNDTSSVLEGSVQ